LISIDCQYKGNDFSRQEGLAALLTPSFPFSFPVAWTNPSPRLHKAMLLPARSRFGEGRSDGRGHQSSAAKKTPAGYWKPSAQPKKGIGR